MASSTTREFRSGPRPDPIYALVVGLYGCALLAPLGIVVLTTAIGNAALLMLGGFATVTLVTAVVGSAAARTPGLAVVIGRHRFAWLLAVVPIALFALLIGGAEASIAPWSVDSVVGWSLLGMISGLFFGLLLTGMSRTRHANARLSDATDLAQWDAWFPQRRRRVVSAILVVGFLCIPAVIAAEEFLGYEWIFDLGRVAFTLALATSIGKFYGRTIRASDAGITVEYGVFRRFRPWSAFESYTLTDDALVVHATPWWRPAIRCDTDRIDEIDLVTDALGSHLPSGSERTTNP